MLATPATLYVSERLVLLAQMLEDVDHSVLTVNFAHLNEWDAELAEVIVEQYYRLDPFLRKGLQNLVARSFPDALENAEGLQREFWVSFTNLPTAKRLRDLKSGCLGKLVCFVGTITRTSEVRPELFLASFRCLNCSTVIKGVEQHFKYSPPLICPTQSCGNRCGLPYRHLWSA
jgi:DNA replication licensing factor MCM6